MRCAARCIIVNDCTFKNKYLILKVQSFHSDSRLSLKLLLFATLKGLRYKNPSTVHLSHNAKCKMHFFISLPIVQTDNLSVYPQLFHLAFWVGLLNWHYTLWYCINHRKAGRFSIYLPRKDGRLSCPKWLLKRACRQSQTQVGTGRRVQYTMLLVTVDIAERFGGRKEKLNHKR